jgi:hypothetical protein
MRYFRHWSLPCRHTLVDAVDSAISKTIGPSARRRGYKRRATGKDGSPLPRHASRISCEGFMPLALFHAKAISSSSAGLFVGGHGTRDQIGGPAEGRLRRGGVGLSGQGNRRHWSLERTARGRDIERRRGECWSAQQETQLR